MNKWKLVPSVWPDTPCPYGSPAHYAQMVAAAPKPSAEVIDAMVERGAMARAKALGVPWDSVTAGVRMVLLEHSRAAILAALEMTDG